MIKGSQVIKVLLVGAGGFVGSMLRYSMSGLVHRILKNTWFPYGTLTVNILGCFLIGFLNGLAESKQIFYAETRLVLLSGFWAVLQLFRLLGTSHSAFCGTDSFSRQL